MPVATAPSSVELSRAREALDQWVRELMQWHFSPETGAPFWLDWAARAGWDPRRDVRGYGDLDKFGPFQDEWLRGGDARRWVPKGYAGRPVYVFETGGSTGVPKSRINVDDFRIDYSTFSDTLPEQYFPKGADWLEIGPSGPRRLRLAIEHLAQHRGGICYMVDLDPRWVIKLIKLGDIEMVELYKRHVHRSGADAAEGARHHQVPVHHAEAARGALRAHLAEEGGHHRRVLRRHRDDPAVPSLRGRGADGGRVLRAHLRQHADGPGRRTSRPSPRTTGRSSTTRPRRAR